MLQNRQKLLTEDEVRNLTVLPLEVCIESLAHYYYCYSSIIIITITIIPFLTSLPVTNSRHLGI